MKILKSALTVLAMAVMITGATSAYFSDSATVAGNTFSAGTLDMTLGKSVNKPFSVTNAYPGYETDWEYVDVYNNGNLPFEVYLRYTLDQGQSDEVLAKSLFIDVADAGPDGICGNDDDDELEVSMPIWNWILRNSRISDGHYDSVGTPGNDNIDPGKTQRVCQRLRLSRDLGNEIQGKSVKFDETIEVIQDNEY